MKQLCVRDLAVTGDFVLPELLGEARITGGGVYVFKPGEIAHPEPRHVHR